MAMTSQVAVADDPAAPIGAVPVGRQSATHRRNGVQRRQRDLERDELAATESYLGWKDLGDEEELDLPDQLELPDVVGREQRDPVEARRSSTRSA